MKLEFLWRPAEAPAVSLQPDTVCLWIISSFITPVPGSTYLKLTRLTQLSS